MLGVPLKNLLARHLYNLKGEMHLGSNSQINYHKLKHIYSPKFSLNLAAFAKVDIWRILGWSFWGQQTLRTEPWSSSPVSSGLFPVCASFVEKFPTPTAGKLLILGMCSSGIYLGAALDTSSYCLSDIIVDSVYRNFILIDMF